MIDGPDPNEGSIDPIEPEYWRLGEDLQDALVATGYESPTVEGIAVDIHDLLQATQRLESTLVPEAIANPSHETLDRLKEEFRHIAWHCAAAEAFLNQVKAGL
jgi:hypothetical protein